MNADQLPKISIVLPVRNNANTIEKAILSVIDQQYPNTELIVIDGGSTDGTLDVIKRYEPHIAYWHSKPDGGCGNAINLGLQQATGELTGQLMADDWFEPGIFHAIAEASIANPTVDVISCAGRIVRLSGADNQIEVIESYSGEKQLALTVHNMCFGIPAMSSRFIKRSVYEKVGLLYAFDKNGKHIYSADREMLLRIAIFNYKNMVIDHLGHSYCAHAASATFGNNHTIKMKIFRDHIDTIDRYFAEFELSNENKKILRKWYTHQSVRYFLYLLCGGSFSAAFKIAIEGLKKYKQYWLASLFSAPYSYAKKIILSPLR